MRLSIYFIFIGVFVDTISFHSIANATTDPLVCVQCVDTSDIKKEAIGSNKLRDLSVTTSKIADGAVTDAKIQNGTVLKSLNSLTDHVNIAGGAGISVTKNANDIVLSASSPTGNGSVFEINNANYSSLTAANIVGVGVINLSEYITLSQDFSMLRNANNAMPLIITGGGFIGSGSQAVLFAENGTLINVLFKDVTLYANNMTLINCRFQGTVNLNNGGSDTISIIDGFFDRATFSAVNGFIKIENSDIKSSNIQDPQFISNSVISNSSVAIRQGNISNNSFNNASINALSSTDNITISDNNFTNAADTAGTPTISVNQSDGFAYTAIHGNTFSINNTQTNYKAIQITGNSGNGKSVVAVDANNFNRNSFYGVNGIAVAYENTSVKTIVSNNVANSMTLISGAGLNLMETNNIVLQ